LLNIEMRSQPRLHGSSVQKGLCLEVHLVHSGMTKCHLRNIKMQFKKNQSARTILSSTMMRRFIDPPIGQPFRQSVLDLYRLLRIKR
jgi:hypothetical protein